MSVRRTWDPFASALGPRFTTVHLADMTQDSTLEAMAARAIAATSGDLLVVAHSMGGRVTMEIGRQALQRVCGMVLASTGHHGVQEDEAEHRQARIDEANRGMAEYGRTWVPKVLGKSSLDDKGLVARIEEMVRECSPDTHARQNAALLARPDAAGYLSEFRFPVLLVMGDEDNLSSESAHAAIAALIADAESTVIIGAGHLLPFERPNELTSVISHWLTRKGLI
jgi:pimeloyl-ACP methyl ester carboxylesterase